MNKLFQSKGTGGHAATPVTGLVQSLQREFNNQGSAFAQPAVAKSAYALESIDQVSQNALDTAVTGLSTALESIGREHADTFAAMTHAQRDAGVTAGVIAGDIQGYLRQPLERNVVAQEGVTFIAAQGGDFTTERQSAAMEAYDERDNRNTAVYSVAYNMQAARQDEFGEAFFPTVVVTPDQVGFTVAIRLVLVYNDFRRQISGELDNFNRKNIIQAVIDPTILKNDLLKIVPVVRPTSIGVFVDPALVAPRNVTLEGEVITTAPFAIGKKFSLLGISQTDSLLETGLMDPTDSLDTAVTLDQVYMSLNNGAGATEVFKFGVSRLPTANFTYALQGNYRQMNLAFTTETLAVNTGTMTIAGAASTILGAPLAANGGYSVRLGFGLSGSTNLQTADTSLFASPVSVTAIYDAQGNAVDLTAGDGAAIVALFASAQIFGYDLDARRTNLNRRQRGQLLDTTFYNQIYAVPLRSPITIPRPLTSGDVNDSSDLAALITATHIRTSNAAVEELLNAEVFLADYVNGSTGDAPEILGVARMLVKPFYEHDVFDVSTQIDSRTSHERFADIQATLVNKLRDMAYRMYRDSGYKAAADALAGGVAPAPTVIIGTDPVIAQYLMVSGDFRTLGELFQVKIVSTLNQTMKGKIIMTFGVPGAGEGTPNPMHFGNMAWKPELTLVLPLHRNGANSKELTVQPSFRHIVNLPIMASLTVTGISNVIASKVAVNTHQV